MSIITVDKKLDEILERLSKVEKQLKELKENPTTSSADQNNLTDYIDKAAAKIIADLTKTMKECPCNKEVLEAIKRLPQDKGKEKVDQEPEKAPEKPKSKYRYSPPYEFVGNPEFGKNKIYPEWRWPPTGK